MSNEISSRQAAEYHVFSTYLLKSIIFAKDLSNKIFSPPRHQDTKLNYNKQLLFVSLCLCGYSIRFIRVGI